MALLRDSVCSVCGAPWEEHARLEVTGCGKILCPDCERMCENYRTYMLPNGTHCMAVFEEEFFKYRLLAMNIPAAPSAVTKTRKKYRDIKSGELFETLAAKAREYKKLTSPAAAAKARTELEAMRSELYERVQKQEINRHLFEIFANITEMRKEYAR